MNIKWILTLLSVILFVTVLEAKKAEKKGKREVQNSETSHHQKLKTKDAISKPEKNVRKSQKHSKPIESEQKIKVGDSQKRASKKQKREAKNLKTENDLEAPVLKVEPLSKETKVKKYGIESTKEAKNSKKVASENVEQTIPETVQEQTVKENLKPVKSKKNYKKNKREANANDINKFGSDFIDETPNQASIRSAAELSHPSKSIKQESSKNKDQQKTKEKSIQKNNAKETYEVEDEESLLDAVL